MSDKPKRHFTRFHLSALAVVGVSFVGSFFLVSTRQGHIEQEGKTLSAEFEAGPRVETAVVQPAADSRSITLPGEALPYQSVTLYAKVSGYLRHIYVDKGDPVSPGQVLARIESPETDQQYNRAMADLENKRRIAKRSRELVAQHFLSPQAAEQAETDVSTAEADVGSLATIKSYEIIKAPFSGSITARYADEGALIQNAENSQTSALPVVTVVDTRQLRVYCYVEQGDAPYVHVGTAAVVKDSSHPERAVQAKVTRISGELDPKTRTLLTEIDIPGNQSILPGSFVNVSLQIPTAGYVEVPAASLVVRGQGTYIPVIHADHRIEFRAVNVAGTDGVNVQIAEGLKANERVALNLGNEIADGSKVRPATGLEGAIGSKSR